MVDVIFVEHDGTQYEVKIDAGQSLMSGAKFNGVPGIDAECGGACACATCHVIVSDAWLGIVGSASEDESDLLEFSEHRESNSRLSCQIMMHDGLNGLVVHIPESQD